MDWIRDVAPGRAGDAGALERLREYLTPFVHGVLLAHAPHHLANRLVPSVFEEAFLTMSSVTEDAMVGPHVLDAARIRARQRGALEPAEQSSPDALVSEARQLLQRLRALPPETRERLILRMVEGIPGPEIAQVTHAAEPEVRADLERGASRALELLGESASLAGDGYVWDLGGAPLPLVARLETQLTALRYDPHEAAEPLKSSDASSTLLDLGAEEPARRVTAEVLAVHVEDGSTAVPTEPRVPTVPEPPGPNPFERGVATQHASDLPAEAQRLGSVPPPLGLENPFEPTQATVPASDLPAAASAPGAVPRPSSPPKSGLRQLPPEVLRASRPSAPAAPAPVAAAPLEHDTKEAVPLGEVEADATRAQVPLAIRQQTGEHDTRLEEIPEHEALAPAPATTGQLRAATSSYFSGSTPFFVAALLIGLAAAGAWLGVFSSELTAKKSWNLVPVLVASEDLEEGSVINTENISVRSVPDSFINTMAVKPEQLGLVMDQRLAVPVQTGDPLLFNQFLYIRAKEGLASRVMPRGRAFSISTNVLASVGRFVRPSDRVDVIVAFLPPGKNGRTAEETDRVAVTLIQNVPIIATGRLSEFTPEKAVEARDRGYQDVSMLLIPEEVERLALASQLGKIQLTLRTDNDDLSLREPGQRLYSDVGTLLTGERVRALEQKRFAIIRTIRNLPSPEGPRKKK